MKSYSGFAKTWSSSLGCISLRMTNKKKLRKHEQVFTLMVQVGRAKDNGLPPTSSDAKNLCYTPAQNQDEAVRETVRLLKQADTSPLDVTGYGTIKERESEGQMLSDGEKGLTSQAEEKNSVIIAQITPFFENSYENHENSIFGP